MTKNYSERGWVLLVLGLGALAFIIAWHLYEPRQISRTATALIKSFHAPGFALVSLAALWAFKRRGHGNSAYWYAGGMALAAGIIAEAAQIYGPRDANIGDLVKDAIGIVGALGTAVLLDSRAREVINKLWLAVIAIFSVTAVVAAFSNSVALGYALLARYQAMPALLTLEHDWESRLYPELRKGTASVVPRPANWPAPGGDFVLRAKPAGRWDVIIHLFPYPDWRGFNQFSFVAASADNQVHKVTVAIRDIRPGPGIKPNRYGRSIEVSPTPQRFTVSFTSIAGAANKRPFDFRRVDSVYILMSDKDRSAVLLLDDFRLE